MGHGRESGGGEAGGREEDDRGGGGRPAVGRDLRPRPAVARAGAGGGGRRRDGRRLLAGGGSRRGEAAGPAAVRLGATRPGDPPPGPAGGDLTAVSRRVTSHR